MVRDALGNEIEPDAAWCCRDGSGWLTDPDSDNPKPCPQCRETSIRKRRPVREWFDPVPSERVARVLERRDIEERQQTGPAHEPG